MDADILKTPYQSAINRTDKYLNINTSAANVVNISLLNVSTKRYKKFLVKGMSCIPLSYL